MPSDKLIDAIEEETARLNVEDLLDAVRFKEAMRRLADSQPFSSRKSLVYYLQYVSRRDDPNPPPMLPTAHTQSFEHYRLPLRKFTLEDLKRK